MTKEELYRTLKTKFQKVLRMHEIKNDVVSVVCRSLSPQEAIGKTGRTDFPILTGREVMVQAEYKGYKGQAFTDSPAGYSGTMEDILNLDIQNNPHDRGIFIAAMNAVMHSLGLCGGTVHCRADGPEQCAQDMRRYLEKNNPDISRIALIGYQPALLEMLSKSRYAVRVLDLNPDNIGQTRYGVLVEDGEEAKQEIIDSYAELILCTGSTLCNGTMIDYMNIEPEVLFYGVTASGAVPLLELKRACFAERYHSSKHSVC